MAKGKDNGDDQDINMDGLDDLEDAARDFGNDDDDIKVFDDDDDDRPRKKKRRDENIDDQDDGPDDDEDDLENAKKAKKKGDDDSELEGIELIEGDVNEDDTDKEEDEKNEDDTEDDAETGDLPEDIAALPFKDEFKKRLFREHKLRKEADKEATASAAEAMVAREDGFYAERRALYFEEKAYEISEKERTNAIAAKRKEIVKHREDGETDKSVDAEGEISRMEAELVNIRSHRVKLKERKAKLGMKDDEPPKKVSFENRHTSTWMEKNKERWKVSDDGTPLNKWSEIARTEDKKMAEEGWRPASPKYFDELDRRISKRTSGGTKKKSDDGAGSKKETQQRRPERKSPVASATEGRNSAPPGGRRSNNKIAFDMRRDGRGYAKGSDGEIMQEFGLDPKNPEVLKAWATERRKLGSNSSTSRRR